MAPRITSARERSKRSASKRPTSSTNRPARSRASTNSNRITSDRLRNELKDWASDLLTESRIKKQGLLNHKEVSKKRKRNKEYKNINHFKIYE